LALASRRAPAIPATEADGVSLPRKAPVYRGSPPPRSTRLARSIVDAEGIDASIRPITSQSTKFTGSERVYILGAVSTTALSGALVREKSSNLLG